MPSKNKSERLDSRKVQAWAEKRKAAVFTTAQVADKFKVTFRQAAAGVAILRLREVLDPAQPPKTKDGISRWTLA